MEKVKALIKRRLTINNVDNIDEDHLDYYTEEVIQRVLNFCNLTELPEQLYYTVARIVGELVTPVDEKSGGVANKIKVGDTEVNLSPSNLEKAISGIMDDFKSELYAFRKVKW